MNIILTREHHINVWTRSMCGQKSPGVLQRSLGDVLAREHHGDLPYPLVGRELPHVALRAFGRVGLLHFVVMETS